MIIHTYSLKKRKARKPTAGQRQLAAEWDAIVKKYEPKKPVKYKAVTWQPSKSYVRETPHIPSLNSFGGTATKSATKVYTGDKMIGITIIHKSCLQPVFTKQEAEAAASMRR